MRTGLRFILLLLGLWSPGAWALCQATDYDVRAQVDYVYDGDTLRLSNGDKVRLVGVNTPELDHERGHHQPQAEAARDYLQQLLANSDGVYLLYASERHDRYQRVLAHLFLSDGRNINELLLQQGLAFRIAVPPNLRFQDCYRSAEDEARSAHRGVWSQSSYWVLDSRELERNLKGFRLIRGRVVRVEQTQKSIWLVLEGERLRVRIARSDMASLGADPQRWLGQTILLRGWVYGADGGLQLRLRHANDVMLWRD